MFKAATVTSDETYSLLAGLEKEMDPKKLSESGIDRVVKKPIPCEDLLRLILEITTPPAQAKRGG